MRPTVVKSRRELSQLRQQIAGHTLSAIASSKSAVSLSKHPHNDLIRHPDDLREFRRIVRRVYNEFKATHGEGLSINVFPAIPVSAAIELGRVWMPKADLQLLIFDQVRERGFVPRLTIG